MTSQSIFSCPGLDHHEISLLAALTFPFQGWELLTHITTSANTASSWTMAYKLRFNFNAFNVSLQQLNKDWIEMQHNFKWVSHSPCSTSSAANIIFLLAFFHCFNSIFICFSFGFNQPVQPPLQPPSWLVPPQQPIPQPTFVSLPPSFSYPPPPSLSLPFFAFLCLSAFSFSSFLRCFSSSANWAATSSAAFLSASS